MNQLVRGYIIKVNQYKEADAIVNLLTESGDVLAFKVRGMFKPNSKNNPSCQIFTKGEYLLDYKTDYSHKALKSGTVLEQLNLLEKIEPNIILGLMSEVIILIEDLEPSTRISLFESIFMLLKAQPSYLGLVLMILKYVMLFTGTQLEASSCVSCGTTEKIVTLSYDAGGYLCSACNTKLNSPLKSKEYLTLFRYIMKADLDDLAKFNVAEFEANILIKDLFNYIEHSLGFKFKSRVLIETALF